MPSHRFDEKVHKNNRIAKKKMGYNLPASEKRLVNEESKESLTRALFRFAKQYVENKGEMK